MMVTSGGGMSSRANVAANFDRLLLLFVSAVAFVLLANWPKAFFGGGSLYLLTEDDSMISLRVAYNFANGFGPYFNLGERVAANTSLIWPIICSALYKFYGLAPAIEYGAYWSAAIAVAILASVIFGASSAAAAALAAFLILVSPTLRHFGPTLWEHVPQALLVTLSFLAILGRLPLREHWRIPLALVLASLAFLVRPDTLPILTVIGLVALHQWFYARKPTHVLSILFSAAAVLGYFAAHYYFYKSFVPNTYYLKVSDGAAQIRDGLAYLLRATFNGGFTAVAIAAGLLTIGAVRAGDRLDVGHKIVWACIGLQTAYVVSVGGDIFWYGRFFLLLFPIVALFAAERVAELWTAKEGEPHGRNWTLVASAVLLFLSVSLVVAFVIERRNTRMEPQRLASVGDPSIPIFADTRMSQIALSNVIRKLISPAEGEIGLAYLGISYYLPEYRIADFLGKADPVIAHQSAKPGNWVGHSKWDVAHSLIGRNVTVFPFATYFLSRDPVTGRYGPSPRLTAEASGGFQFASDFAASDLVWDKYEFFSPAMLGQDHSWGLFVRKDLAHRVRERLGPARQ